MGRISEVTELKLVDPSLLRRQRPIPIMFADLELAQRLEAAEAAKYAAYARARRCVMADVNPAVLAVAGGVAVYAGPDSPYNRAVGVGLRGPVSEAEFERMEAFFANYRVTPQVSLCPLADRSLLGHLGRNGYRVDMFMHTWVREISPTEDFHLPKGIIICPASCDESNLWVRVAFKGGLDSEDAEPGRSAVIAAYPYMAHTTCYLAWLDGEAAGAATLTVSEGLAEMFGSSTRPSFRNRGVHSALLASRLAEAQRLGCDLAIVHTEPGSASQRNVERMGFWLAYTKLHLTKEA
jgi:GNAT superfamily N-acetyltransferase